MTCSACWTRPSGFDLAFALRDLDVDSVPVNFLLADEGTPLAGSPLVEPNFALRTLCMFRFVHPRTDLRVAGFREVTLRSLQVMSLYPANSIFTQGYLTRSGTTPQADHQMIRDAGSSSSSRRARRSRPIQRRSPACHRARFAHRFPLHGVDRDRAFGRRHDDGVTALQQLGILRAA
jgi:biotin synthase-like enzyme